MKSRLTKLLLGAVAGLIAPSVGFAQSDAPLKIGVVLSLSGPAAVFGLPERDAIQAITEELNKGSGRKIELVIYDDKTDPSEAARGVTQVVSRDKVVAIIGPGTGSGILAAGPIAERQETPLLGPAGTVTITDKKNSFYPWIFRVAPGDVTDIKVILSDAAKDGAKRIGILHQEDAYGKAGVDFSQGLVKELGLEIISVVSAPLNSTDLTAQATKLREAKPDAVFMQISIAALGASFVRAAQQVGLAVPLYANAGLAQKSFLDAVGAQGDGVRVLSIGNIAYDPSPAEKKLADILIARGKQPQGWGELVGSNGLMAAVAAAKTIKGPIDGKSMRDALETLCGFETYSRGKPCFTKDNHDGWHEDSLVITEIKAGKLIDRKK